VRSLED
jgi:hypothetical protein